MPAIDTPFMMELRPGDELQLAQARHDSSTDPAPSTNAFSKNAFRATVSGIVFVEEEDAEDSDTAAAALKKPHKQSVIRVALIAHMQPPTSTTSPVPPMKAVTLASCNFDSAVSSNADATTTTTASSSLVTRVESSVQLRSPLLFHSGGSIQSLSVVAESMATTAGTSGSSGSVKRYQGSRRFIVRLHGIQQTFLTEEQVVLLSQR